MISGASAPAQLTTTTGAMSASQATAIQGNTRRR